jgi:hypothetical protein
MKTFDYPRAALVLGYLFVAVSSELVAAEPSAEDMKVAADRRVTEIASLQAKVEELDLARKEASSKQRYRELRNLSLQLKDARTRLKAAQDMTIEDFARVIGEEREAAKKAMEAEQEATQRAADKAAAQRANEQKERERQELSGGCPLEIIGGNFFHSQRIFGRTLGRPGPCTVVKCITVNRAEAPVEAYELLVQFYDGFDKLIAEHKLQGALLKPNAESDSLNAFPMAETVKSMHIYIERTKMQDGAIWERKPEHRRTGMIWKKPEGAKLVD